MGIDGLFKVISSEAPDAIKIRKISYYKNKKVAIDTSLIIYQYVIALRSRGMDLMTEDGKATTHIHGIINKTISLLEQNVHPVYVFDGKPPTLKNRTLEMRSKLKKKAKTVMDETDDEDERIKMFKRTTTVTREQMSEVRKILKYMGIPYIKAPEEADSQCAYLSKNNLVHGVATEDMDILTFGTNRLLRKFSAKKKGNIIEIDLKKVLSEMDITMKQFIEMCILLGSDYSPTIYGLGKKGVLNVIRDYKDVKAFVKSAKFKKGRYRLPEDFNLEAAKKYFLTAPVKKVTAKDLEWRKPDYIKLKTALIDEYELSNTRTTNIITKLKKAYADYAKRQKFKSFFK
jgi:flap endonuclease-1